MRSNRERDLASFVHKPLAQTHGIRRIHITGNAGSGKTTLAAAVGRELSLPVYSLDSIVWQPGWRKTPRGRRMQLEQELTSRPSWVIDGVSKHVRESSDLVVLLDVPRRRCVWRASKRYVRHFAHTRPGLPLGCTEWRSLPKLLRIIWQFPTNAGLEIWQEAAENAKKYMFLSNSYDAREVAGRVSGV